MQSIPRVLTIADPAPGHAIPVLVDSPHSGRDIPDDFNYDPFQACIDAWQDRHVDQLIRNYAALGATVIKAEAPRSYIDLNRARNEFSKDAVCDTWDGFKLQSTAFTAWGIGLIWTNSSERFIYAQKPTSAEVLARIEKYYDPYYATLEDRAQKLKKEFGKFYHLNIHSMPPKRNTGRKTDIVLGNLHGKSCSAEFLEIVTDAFNACGYHVGINQPYPGARLTELFGSPAQSSESLQIEISKDLYLKPSCLDIDEAKFARIQHNLESVLKIIGNYALGVKTPENEALRAASRSPIETRLPSAAREVTP